MKVIMLKHKNYLNLLTLLCSLYVLMGCTKDMNHKHHAHMKKTIHVHGAWVRAVPPVSHMSAAYLTIMNHGDKEDQLLSVETKLSKVAELHNVKEKDGMMSMFPVQFVPVTAGGVQDLKPGSYHIMLINLNKTPKLGEEYELVLTFKNAGIVKTSAAVKEGGSMQKMEKHGAMEHDHGSSDSNDDY